jgi:hypothetical protein
MRAKDALALKRDIRSNKGLKDRGLLDHVFLKRQDRMASEKPVADRVKECAAILTDIQSLGIPSFSPELAKLRGHMNEYIRDGTCWSGVIDFSAYGRIAEVVFPRRADKPVEVLLRVPRAKR